MTYVPINSTEIIAVKKRCRKGLSPPLSSGVTDSSVNTKVETGSEGRGGGAGAGGTQRLCHKAAPPKSPTAVTSVDPVSVANTRTLRPPVLVTASRTARGLLSATRTSAFACPLRSKSQCAASGAHWGRGRGQPWECAGTAPLEPRRGQRLSDEHTAGCTPRCRRGPPSARAPLGRACTGTVGAESGRGPSRGLSWRHLLVGAGHTLWHNPTVPVTRHLEAPRHPPPHTRLKPEAPPVEDDGLCRAGPATHAAPAWPRTTQGSVAWRGR